MEVGLETQPAPRKFLRIKAPITVEEADKSVGLFPCDVPTFSCEIDFPHPAVGFQQLKIHLSPQVFLSEGVEKALQQVGIRIRVHWNIPLQVRPSACPGEKRGA